MLLGRVAFGTLLMALTCGVSAGDIETEVGLDLGYRKVDLQWSIAGDSSGCCPNILSELTWSDVQATQLKATIDTTFSKRFKVFGMAAYATIFSGDNQDSDYIGDNRTQEFSRSNNDASDGDLIDLSIGIGFLLGRAVDEAVNRGVRFYPKIGYSYHEQNFVMTKGYQTWPPTGSFPGLNSTYEAVWHGPWMGLAMEFELGAKQFLGVEYQYHIAEYTGVGNWNLRSDFEHPKSFEHTDTGYGQILDITYRERLSDAWGWGFGLLIENWQTDIGNDKVFFSNGVRVETQLNEVAYSSSTVSFKVDYFF
ncbi:MAG: hypothetical protein L3J28_10570 [Candidatus Polarisedimenticolaceae bacterium]|nr:hypothetical protein [Candidatus Polarisedimenticolaceae bacterium]